MRIGFRSSWVLSPFVHGRLRNRNTSEHTSGDDNPFNKIANHNYKVPAYWLNHRYSPWESEDYKVESHNERQLRLT